MIAAAEIPAITVLLLLIAVSLLGLGISLVLFGWRKK